MADWQHAFLSKVVLDGEIMAAVNARITPDFFPDDQYRKVYTFCLDHWQSYGTPADEDVVHGAFPAMRWKPQAQPIGFLIDRLLAHRQFVIVTGGMTEAANYVHDPPDDPETARHLIEPLQGALIQARLETSAARDFDITLSRSSIEELLEDRQQNPGHLRGISTGVDGIDYVTGGLQPEQFIVLIGTPKSFKSATLLHMARAVHQQARVPLFIGFEMSNTEQTDRLLSLASGVSLTKIMQGKFNLQEFREIQKALKLLEDMRPFLFSTDITSATTVSGVQAKIQEYSPDVVFVDGAYLMQSEIPGVETGSPQAMTSVSRNLKRLAQSQRLPIVVTTQASGPRSRGGLSLSSPMYSQAWGQDCDILLGVERQTKDDEDETGEATVKFKVIESRSGPRKEVYLVWDWSKGSVRELDPVKERQKFTPRSRLQDPDDDEYEDSTSALG